jgi:hypothetical protein
MTAEDSVTHLLMTAEDQVVVREMNAEGPALPEGGGTKEKPAETIQQKIQVKFFYILLF